MNYFSIETIAHLCPQQGLSKRHQQRALDVTLAAKLTLTYGKYHLAMLHRELAMSEERTTYQQAERQAHTSRWKAAEDVYHVDARSGGLLPFAVIKIFKYCFKLLFEPQGRIVLYPVNMAFCDVQSYNVPIIGVPVNECEILK